ncbi:TPA: hypothetical protein PXN62_003199 [Yersinia enterocolitica]|nr:hypothetical protein [Yersinia enterocolitica]
MIRVIIRILSFIGCIGAVIFAWKTASTASYFTALGFFITLAGTFVVNKPQSGHVVKQKGGAFSTNNQNVYFGNSSVTGKEDNKK